jgi:tRNA pseudouridine38-40 synthase
LEKINSCCSEFVGSHNFHNYSKNLRAKDPQSQRYILRFWVKEHSKDYLIFHVIGQSFIYHQIRKMVGCIIMVFINQNPPTYIPNTFFRNQICMPLAPARGLYLRALSFDNYNKKKEIPEPLNIESQTVAPLEEAISRFITDQDDQEWTDWISQLRESIYHGIQCPQEEEPHPSKSRAIE